MDINTVHRSMILSTYNFMFTEHPDKKHRDCAVFAFEVIYDESPNRMITDVQMDERQMYGKVDHERIFLLWSINAGIYEFSTAFAF